MTAEEIAQQIADIEGQLQLLEMKWQQESEPLHEKLHALKLDYIKEKFGVVIGSVVVFKGKEFRVTEIDPRYIVEAKPWLCGNPKVKDGSWGKARRALYSDWETPKS